MAAPLPISGRQKATQPSIGSASRHSEQPFRIQQKNLSMGMVDSTPNGFGPTPTSNFGSTSLGPVTSASFKQASNPNRRWADYTPSGVTPSTVTLGQEHPTASVVFPNTPTPLEYSNTQGLSFSQIMGSSTSPAPMSVSASTSTAPSDRGRNGGYVTDPPPSGFDRMEPAMVPPPVGVGQVGQQLLQSAFAPTYFGAQATEEHGARLKVKNTFIDDYDSDEDSFQGTATHELGAKSLPVGLVRSGGPPGQLGNALQYQRVVTAQASSLATAAVLKPPPGNMAMPPGQMFRQPQVATIQPTLGMSMLGSPLSMPTTAPSQSTASTVIQPYNIRQPQPSIGSDKHGTGECRPCAWFWKPQGCANGADCRHCHMCPEGELKNRKKDKVYQMRTTTR